MSTPTVTLETNKIIIKKLTGYEVVYQESDNLDTLTLVIIKKDNK